VWHVTALTLNYLKPAGLSSYLGAVPKQIGPSLCTDGKKQVIAPSLWTESCHVSPRLGMWRREAAKWGASLG